MYHHVKRATRHLIFWSLVSVAICLSAIRLVLIGVDQYKSDLETRLSAMVGSPVQMGGIRAKMRGISPELVLKDITIKSAIATEKSAISLNEIRLGIHLGDLLVKRDILASSSVALVGATMSIIRNREGQFLVEGLRSSSGQPLWLLKGQRYQVLHSQITWQDKLKGLAPILLDDVNLAVMNNGNHHQINALAHLPNRYGNELKLSVDVEASVQKPEALNGRFYVSGKQLKLHEMAASYLPYNININAGVADLQLWGDLHQANVSALKGELALKQAVFARKGAGVFPINQLETQFNAKINESQWQLSFDKFQLETPESDKKTHKQWPDAIFSVGKSATPNLKPVFKLYIKQLDLAEAAKLVHFFAPIPDEQANILNVIQPQGLLKNFTAYLEPEAKLFAVAGWFDDISAAAYLNYPGIENISGEVKGSETVGVLALASQNSRFNLANIYGKPIDFKRLTGKVAWHQNDEQWQLSSASVQFSAPSLETESRFQIDIPKTEGKPFMDLQTAFKISDAKQIASYLPLPIMKEKPREWLGNAFHTGVISNGNLLLYGNMADFPFIDGQGVWQVGLDVANGELNFRPDWPHVSGINGKVLIERNNIQGWFDKGIIGKVDIGKTEMLLSGLGVEAQLSIKGEAKGEINQALSVLQQSPLTSRVMPVTNNTTVAGNAEGGLSLLIPLTPGHEIQVDGFAKLANAKMAINWINLPVSKITGDLKFNKKGIYADKISGEAFDKPISVNIAQEETQTVINVNGKANVADVENLFAWQSTGFAEGESEYLAQLNIPNSPDNAEKISLSLKSTLEGVALNLPGSLSKTSLQSKPSVLAFNLTGEQMLPIALDYNNEMKAAVNYDIVSKKINSGHLVIGSGQALPSNKPGIKLEINRDQLPLQDWLALGGQQQAEEAGYHFNEIGLHSPSALWKKTKLGAFDLFLRRDGQIWRGQINSVFAKGVFDFPVDLRSPIPTVLNLDMLNLSAIKQFGSVQETAPTTSEIRHVPVLNIHSNKTLWQSANLGKLDVETIKSQQGLTIKKLSLNGANEKLQATGEWTDFGNRSSTQLKGRLDLKKADKFFSNLRITKDFTQTKGKIDFQLNWPNMPWSLSFADLRGNMDVALGSGRILSIEPGFGRVLGILAVAQWLKRLQFDFSDVFEEGLSFDSITGHFDLYNGKATTKNLFIDAVPAKITIVGDTDLVEQTVDHTIKVVPKSLDAFPIAGTIVGNMANVIGKTLTGKDQEGFLFGQEYLVKGPWHDAKVKPLHDNDGLLQKTWNSITDFPWNEPPKE